MDAKLDRFVALDVEIASRRPLAVCAVGATRVEFGCETAAFSSLVRFDGRVSFSRIHGLHRADLKRAPPWPVVWKRILAVLDDIRIVVAFKADFDRGALLVMSARHGIRMPRMEFVCAAEMLEHHCGLRLGLEESLMALALPFPGRPHEPLADARAAALVVRHSARSQLLRPKR